MVLTDHNGRAVRFTLERLGHVLEHPEMAGQLDRVTETLARPEQVVASIIDPSVHVYSRFYPTTPVTSKYMHVAIKVLPEDAFILTAYYSSREKRGEPIWKS